MVMYGVHHSAQFVYWTLSSIIGSQCNCWSAAAVTWSCRFRFKISLAAAFRTRWSGANHPMSSSGDLLTYG